MRPQEQDTRLHRGAEKVQRRHGVIISNIGHEGDGNVHSIIAWEGQGDDEWRRTLDAVIGELIDLAIGLGGTISGEHGLGLAKEYYPPRQVEGAQIEIMRAVKSAFAPPQHPEPRQGLRPLAPTLLE